ncbi:DUF2256 domain-containing protein [Marinobacterium sp. LSUCC0821]|nr:DUF2256 domain-containing protein [Marinobacterium sp. LSUCC0821]QJD71355.1 DUF2256 domain-containing protein [Marinobacterium sp. LSUCC0821]
MHHKQTLPSKECEHCQRPFNWRKKWARDWVQVRYCSERCKREAKKSR